MIDFFYPYILIMMGSGGETSSIGEKKNPNCLKCVHFKVTWDPVYPRACEMFGIKGQNLPSVEVHNATGLACPAYILKEKVK